MEQHDIQQQFFQHIKNNLPAHLSFVDNIAELLEISNDSAYRRIRGEKQLSFEEIKKLCTHFNLSIDQLLNLKTDAIIFNGQFVTDENFRFDQYLQSQVKILQQILSFDQKEIIYLSKDIPIFHYFMFPEVAAFKYFVWMKTILHDPRFSTRKFSLHEDLMTPLVEIGKGIGELYCQIPSTEIMNIENIMTTLRQLEYYKDAALIASEEDTRQVYDKMQEMVDHMESQTEAGKKFMPGRKPDAKAAPIKVYVNDFIIGDNSIIAVLNGNRLCHVVHNVLNYMTTRDTRYSEYSFNSIQNLIKKSMLISMVGEKERNKFFNLIRERITMCRNNEMKTLGKI